MGISSTTDALLLLERVTRDGDVDIMVLPAMHWIGHGTQCINSASHTKGKDQNVPEFHSVNVRGHLLVTLILRVCALTLLVELQWNTGQQVLERALMER